MEAKPRELFGIRSFLSYIAITALIYIIFLIIPGVYNENYIKFLGTFVFAFLVLMSLRSCLIAFISMKSNITEFECGNDLPFVSIIVAAYYEEAVLDRTIQSVLELDYPQDKLEALYVYESNCTDRTEEIILKYAKQNPCIRPIRRTSKSGGHAAANNHGIRLARGEIIGIFDADQSLDSDLLKKAVISFNNPTIGCVRGRCRAINRGINFLARAIALERDAIERIGIYGTYLMGGFANFGGSHGFFKREIFEKVGLFDEEILCEDIDFSVRLYKERYKIVHNLDMQSWEEVPTRIQPWWAQRKRWARGWIQVWRKHYSNILNCEKMPKYNKIDTLISLAGSISPVLSIFIFPLFFLSRYGYQTTFLSENSYQILWLFIIIMPLATGLLVWTLDRQKYGRQSLVDIPVSFLLLPYILLQFMVNWIALVDEFILKRPSTFVKTERDDHRISSYNKGRILGIQNVLLFLNRRKKKV